MTSGLITAGLLVAFIAIVFWAWSAHNRQRFDEAANLPLKDEAAAPHAGGECCGCGKGGRA